MSAAIQPGGANQAQPANAAQPSTAFDIIRFGTNLSTVVPDGATDFFDAESIALMKIALPFSNVGLLRDYVLGYTFDLMKAHSKTKKSLSLKRWCSFVGPTQNEMETCRESFAELDGLVGRGKSFATHDEMVEMFDTVLGQMTEFRNRDFLQLICGEGQAAYRKKLNKELREQKEKKKANRGKNISIDDLLAGWDNELIEAFQKLKRDYTLSRPILEAIADMTDGALERQSSNHQVTVEELERELEAKTAREVDLLAQMVAMEREVQSCRQEISIRDGEINQLQRELSHLGDVSGVSGGSRELSSRLVGLIGQLDLTDDVRSNLLNDLRRVLETEPELNPGHLRTEDFPALGRTFIFALARPHRSHATRLAVILNNVLLANPQLNGVNDDESMSERPQSAVSDVSMAVA